MNENTTTAESIMNQTIKDGARAWGAYLALKKATLPFQVKVGRALIEIKNRAGGNTKIMGEIRQTYFKRPDGSTIRNDEASNMMWVAKYEPYVAHLFNRSDSVKMVRRLYGKEVEQATRELGKVPDLPDGIFAKATMEKLETIANPPESAPAPEPEPENGEVIKGDEIALKPESIINRLNFINEQFSVQAENFNDVQFKEFTKAFRELQSLIHNEKQIREQEATKAENK